MKTANNTGQGGFTLIETLMAMAIFTIGILGLFGMQTAVITKNLAANTITTGATWAADRIELLLGRNYSDLGDIDSDGCAGLNDRRPASAGGTVRSDGDDSSGTVPPVYRMYWNVAVGCSMSSIPTPKNPKEEQKPKHIRVIVTVQRLAGEQEVAIYDYIKQNAKTN
ncbi:MAG: type IV pilus modification PilV family protein [Candidatus Electronema sp. VV]